MNCIVCNDQFELDRDDRQPFPDQWHLLVHHDHEVDPPVWRALLFYRKPRGKYPPNWHELMDAKSRQKRAQIAELASHKIKQPRGNPG